MGDAAHLDIRAPAGGPLRSRRLLRLAGDDRLVEQIRRGSEAAFEVAFERHAPAILAFCRHMLGSPEEGEDAVQHTFAAAYRDLQRGGEREIALRPWLFTIARNRCLSVLRSRREQPLGDREIATAGLADQVERRAELRELLRDVRELPDDQRAALLLAEAGGLAQADIAAVVGCEVARVKALVYRARSALVARREARELPCEQIREQLASLRGGSLRRTELRLHLRECSGCRDFREQVRRQRQLLSVALPVVPTLGLKGSVLGAVGIGGGAAGGIGAAGAAGGGAAAGIAKLAAVGVLAAGGVAGGTAVVVHERDPTAPPGPDSAPETPAGGATAAPDPPAERLRISPQDEPPGQAKPNRGRGHTGELRARTNPGRGPVEAPPRDTPVRRGPPEAKAKLDKAAPGRVKAKPERPAPGAKAKSEPQRSKAPGAAKPEKEKTGPPQARPRRVDRPDSDPPR
jgi:RNA polymerase sigma factor (sigma-70 family)